MRLKRYAISGWETSDSSKKLATTLPPRSGKRVVDHARAEADDAETYGAVANEAAKLIPQECEESARVGSRGERGGRGMVNRISSKSTVVYAIGLAPLSICL